MKTINVRRDNQIPKNFTGIVQFSDKTKEWWLEGKFHRLDGPAIEFRKGQKQWYVNDKQYLTKSLKDYVVLDHYQGEYGIMWYKLLDKDKIFEYPDIPGLIEK